MKAIICAGVLVSCIAAVASAQVLYNNGPLVTDPGAGFGGFDVSRVQPGESYLGYNVDILSTIRLADDFTVSDTAGWNINSINFYAYQSFAPQNGTITAINFRIWDGVPGEVGSNVVFGDTTTNRLSSSVFSGIYRTRNMEPTNGDRAIQSIVAAADITLAAGTYWLDWSIGGSGASGTWQPPVTLVGQFAPANANALRSFNGGAFTIAIDPGSQVGDEFPFMINGSVVSILCPGDIADDFGTLGADGQVSFGDFLALLGLIGPCPGGTPGCTGDIADDFGTIGNEDAQVSFGDFLALLGLIGPCP
jgi:hypothetical protein